MLGELSQVGEREGQAVDACRRRAVVKATVGDDVAEIAVLGPEQEGRVVADRGQRDLRRVPGGGQHAVGVAQHPGQDAEAHRRLRVRVGARGRHRARDPSTDRLQRR